MSEQIRAEMTATVWKILVAEGESVTVGEELMILESMKMEIPIIAETGGSVASVLVAEGSSVSEGDVLLTVQT